MSNLFSPFHSSSGESDFHSSSVCDSSSEFHCSTDDGSESKSHVDDSDNDSDSEISDSDSGSESSSDDYSLAQISQKKNIHLGAKVSKVFGETT